MSDQKSSKTTLILFLTVFIDMMGFSIIFPLFPNILKQYTQQGQDPLLAAILSLVNMLGGAEGSPYYIVLFGGILGSIYSILQFVFSPIWGRISDRIGRKPILLMTSSGNFLGYLIWLFSGSFSIFVLSRVITGVMGGNISVASAAMADSTSEADRAKGMGMIGAGIGLGFIFGPPISGLLSNIDLAKTLPFSFTYFPASALFAVFIALVNLLLLFFSFVETLPEESRKVKQDAAIHPILNLKNSSSKQLARVCLIFFLFTFAFSGFEFCINFYLDNFFRYSPRQIGYTFVYIGMIIIFIQGGVIRRISGKVSEKRITYLGGLALLFGLVLLASFIRSTGFFFFSLLFISSGSAFLHPGLSSLTSLVSSKSEQGKNIGIMRGFGALARALSPFAFSLVYFRLQPRATFLLSASLILLVILLTKGIDDSKYSVDNS
ncbi:MAG: MFS transporter [Spirochaetota bacterium]